ncbi:MAG: pyridoxal phosphate-dependent aminotransferase [Ignavibacteria bacterium]|nr:pyridoxal phosphate-dependent aminotransferase [Ignavibacteria bacterium]MCC7158992.1 pyridoxal phosphate-dependent aminotransferase [Ignavibacteria bacterium]
MKFSDGISRLGTETAFEVLAKAKALEAEGKSIIHLQIGEPDFPTPKNICDAAVASIQAGDTHYTGAAGTPELRKAIADYVSRTRDVKFTPENVVMTPGAKPIMFFVILALLQHGDEAMYPNPGFPIYESMINFVGAKAVPMPLTQENNFNVDLKLFEKSVTDKTRLVIINTPGNPTGKTIPRAVIHEMAEILKNRDCMILSDEIYSRIVYDGAESYSISKIDGFKDRTIILDGFSKTYAMTGWRAGYGIMNTELAPVITKLMVNSNSCNNAFVQKGCIEALNGPQDAVVEIVAEFDRRRKIIVEGLNSIKGFNCSMPDGAFYAFPNITGTGFKSKELADKLLYEAGVACLSGTSFGAYGEGYIRFSYANSVENINEAINRIKKVLS